MNLAVLLLAYVLMQSLKTFAVPQVAVCRRAVQVEQDCPYVGSQVQNRTGLHETSASIFAVHIKLYITHLLELPSKIC